ncbi:sortilin-like [Clytia hemisphaerica]|uniref:VPS10 domain-containing protein n=1 Tax=Clytia hemisphaerica TaxID=252671 RepID=A0A7M5XBB6_9CNID
MLTITIFLFFAVVGQLSTFDINLPEASHRYRREISDSKTIPPICKSHLNEEAKKKMEKNEFPLKSDKNNDVALVWLGDNLETQILLTTVNTLSSHFLSIFNIFGKHESPSNIYRSTDGGKSFQNIEINIGKEAIRSEAGIFKSPVDPKMMILVSKVSRSFFSVFSKDENKDHGALIVTKDSAATFEINKLPFDLREGDSIRFHPKRKDWIIALEKPTVLIAFGKSKKTGTAHLSTDFGRTWTPIMKDEILEEIKWGTMKGHEDEIFAMTKVVGGFSFVMHGFGTAGKNALYKTKINPSDPKKFAFKKVVESVESFGIQDEFVFATVVIEKDDGDDERIIHVSKDSGETFNVIHFPRITTDKFFAVMEMYKGLIFLHEDGDGDTGKGTLYISGPEGRVYEKSLKDHFYTNQRLTDFYKVQSMPGVYITQRLIADNTLKSVITFDRGVKWRPLYVERSVYCTDKKYKDTKVDCSLHFHHIYSRRQSHSVAQYVQSPISSPSAPGLILVHGVAGDGLTGKMNVWMSKNGGYNWIEVAKGPHHYAIGDNGNLIILVPKLNATGTTLKYSIDQGRCWHEFEFTSKNQPLQIQGLVTEPHSQERSFSLWGLRKDAKYEDKEWIIVTVDFGKMLDKTCALSDFENWSPHKLNGKDGCFLGEKITYKRPKEDSICHVGRKFNPVVATTKCPCTVADFVCDYGYKRDSSNKCIRDKTKSLMFCVNGEEELESPSKGYRRVPGDTCENKDSSKDMIKMIDEKKKCTTTEKDKYIENHIGIVSEDRKFEEQAKIDKLKQQKDLALEEEENRKLSKKPTKKKNSALIVFGVVVVLALVVVAIIYARRHIKMRDGGAQYVRSTLDDDGGEDEKSHHRSRNNRSYQNEFHDETDNDEELLPV